MAASAVPVTSGRGFQLQIPPPPRERRRPQDPPQQPPAPMVTVPRYPNGVQFQPAAAAATLPQTSCPSVGASTQLAWTKAQRATINVAAQQTPS
eukprot:9611647-Alexandrium_andersonii.AAC.1